MNNLVYETAKKEIEMLNNLSLEELSKNPYLLKISQLKNSHILTIIKQQELDYKTKDLELKVRMYDLRNDRNNVMKENIILQEKKLK